MIKTYNQLECSLFFEELKRQGLENVFIAPGSRSTPLVLASQEKEFKTHVHFDERGLAFMALGAAKRSQLPSAVITTSGTATANLLPAIIEAYYSEAPLLILTADRPFELIDVGANQAIQQKNLYSDFIHGFFDVPPPNDKTKFESILTMASHAYQTAIRKKGPVHINFRFQEPLAPLINELDTYRTSPKIESYLDSKNPYVQFSTIHREGDIRLPLTKLPEKGVILVGPLVRKEELDAIFKTSQILNYPVLCDVQSPMRFFDHRENINYFDLILDTAELTPPEIFIQFGGVFTSKRLNQFIEKSNAPIYQIHNSLKQLNETHTQRTFIESTAQKFYEAIKLLPGTGSKEYLNEWVQKNEFIRENLSVQLADVLNEASLPYHLMAQKRSAIFFVGSSMPIRDLERFSGKMHRHEIYFNRGASGIDGNIATALGISLGQSDVICVLGDLTTLHDLNSLTYLKKHTPSFKLIVVNNDGGGIFSFLPISQIDSHIDRNGTFEKFFSTPHSMNFEKLAHGLEISYFKAESPKALEDALVSKGHCLIEVPSSKGNNLEFHRSLTEKLKNR